MPTVLPLSRGGGKCHEKSAEAIVTRTTTGEGPNFVLRTGALAVRVTADTEGRAEMRGVLRQVPGGTRKRAVRVCQDTHWQEIILFPSRRS